MHIYIYVLYVPYIIYMCVVRGTRVLSRKIIFLPSSVLHVHVHVMNVLLYYLLQITDYS